MNTFDIFAIVLSCISSIGNSSILLKSGNYNSELKELNVFLACVFAICNIYTIYKNRKPEPDELSYFNPSNEPDDNPNDESIYIPQTNDLNYLVPSSSFFVDEE
jgi:hypothetical protein